MIRYILVFLFVCLQTLAYNQVIEGTVIDKNTLDIIPFATIYFNGTSHGACSDLKGNFELDISKYASMPITISAIGYFSQIIDDYVIGEHLDIALKPKVYEFTEAVVNSKSLVRQRRANLKIFRNEFIGITENSWTCTILNEEDITFNYYTDKDTLRAYASKPIIISNKAMGYNITYFLEKFEFYRDTEFTFFAGNFIFEEDSTQDQNLVNKNREYAYNGSRMHFFRSLWANKLASNNFKIKNRKGKTIKYKDIVVQDNNGNKYLKSDENLYIYYYSKRTELILYTSLLYFSKEGNFSPEGMLWNGAMSIYRIADWLPLEYKPED